MPRTARARTAVVTGLASGLLLMPSAASADPAATAGDPESPSQDSLESSVTSIDPAPSVTGIDPGPSVEELEQERTEGSTTTVTVSADVLFAFDDAELGDEAADTIPGIAARLDGVTGEVRVVGHSDGLGDDAYDQDLSEQRADAVKEAIEAEPGAQAPPIEAEGEGSSEPVAEETGSEGEDVPAARAQNRRVEISYEGA